MYEIRPVPGVGLGLVATQVLPAGTVICEEIPVCLVNGKGTFHTAAWDLTATALQSPVAHQVLGSLQAPPPPVWDEDDEHELQALLQAHPALSQPQLLQAYQKVSSRTTRSAQACIENFRDATVCLQVVAANLALLGGGVALYQDLSYINYSCAPNAELLQGQVQQELTATKRIERGEEITIAYVIMSQEAADHNQAEGYAYQDVVKIVHGLHLQCASVGHEPSGHGCHPTAESICVQAHM